jgi:hypothetical protein
MLKDRTTAQAKRSFLIFAVWVALCATHTVDARAHHRAPKSTAAPVTTTTTSAKIPVEPNRDPADVALDRKIKGICKGC